jgi:high-affinity iron transporter
MGQRRHPRPQRRLLSSGDATTSWLGAVLGILLEAAIGYGIYKGGVRLNLARFFRITGLVLVVVAAGLVMTAFHTANEAGWLSVGQTQAFDLSWLVRPGTPLSSLLTGVLGIQPYRCGSKSSPGSPTWCRCS